MVPPAWVPVAENGAPAISRQGDQITYAFFKDGVQTLVLRPGFRGSVDQFGMLIPFPSPPAIRKTADDTFTHLAAAVDAPVVTVDLNERIQYLKSVALSSSVRESRSKKKDGGLKFDEVKVISQEAVGMYEVAVLEAGSSAALAKWMEDHEFRYPDGMDKVIEDYVAVSWAFVAIKAKVGAMPGVAPVPGMTGVNPKLPTGASFDGHVQGMGFRFKTESPVIPMRLSAFNEASARNLVYVLSESPVRIDGLDAGLVKRQVRGRDVWTNVNDLLPVKVVGGTVTSAMLKQIDPQRDPTPYNGIAKELFAADILAATSGELALPFEEAEKDLLRISEGFGLRGPQIDALHGVELAQQRSDVLGDAIASLDEMTLTVLDGDFDAKYTAANNLDLVPWTMDQGQNTTANWNRQPTGPYIYMSRDSQSWWPR